MLQTEWQTPYNSLSFFDYGFEEKKKQAASEGKKIKRVEAQTLSRPLSKVWKTIHKFI